jgi:hypothetical protein
MDPDLDMKRRHSIDKTVAIPTNHDKQNFKHATHTYISRKAG